MSALTVGSLFSGIGGLELGLERAGMVTRWQVERDEYCRAVLAKHWPDAARFDDVRTVGAHNLPPVDVICGGFPCQDVSSANAKWTGLDGARSGLWTEFARILRELRPRFAVVENVAVLLNRGFDRVLGDLAALGYDAEWECLPAAAVGAPHIRDRVFVIAYRPPPLVDRAGGERRLLADASLGGQRTDQDDAHGPEWVGPKRHVVADAERGRASVADTDGERQPRVFDRSRAAGSSPAAPAWAVDALDEGLRVVAARREWDVEPAVGRVADGVPARVDRLRALGNAVVPQVAEVVGRMIVAHANACEVAA